MTGTPMKELMTVSCERGRGPVYLIGAIIADTAVFSKDMRLKSDAR